MELLRRYKKLIIESALVIVLVGGAAMGGRDSSGGAGQERGFATVHTLVTSMAEIMLSNESALPQTETIPESGNDALPELSEKQTDLLASLESVLRQGDLEAVSRLLLEKEQQFISLFYTTFESEDYLYRDGMLSKEIGGEGLVFQKPGTLFYGSFEHGVPSGQVLALQAVNLDAPRYDYSQGTWIQGQMEGEGIIGYRYYEESVENVPKEVKKEGIFAGNLMNGPIRYTSIDRQDQTKVWQMTAENGIAVLDDTWSYDSDTKVYRLLAEGDSRDAYNLNEDESKTIRWMNLIPWAE